MAEVIATKTKIADVILSGIQIISYVWLAMMVLAMYTYMTEGYPIYLLISLTLGLTPIAVTTGLRSLLARSFKPAPFR